MESTVKVRFSPSISFGSASRNVSLIDSIVSMIASGVGLVGWDARESESENDRQFASFHVQLSDSSSSSSAESSDDSITTSAADSGSICENSSKI